MSFSTRNEKNCIQCGHFLIGSRSPFILCKECRKKRANILRRVKIPTFKKIKKLTEY